MWVISTKNRKKAKPIDNPMLLERKFLINNTIKGKTIKILTRKDTFIPLNIFKFEIRKTDQHIEFEVSEKTIFKANTTNATYKKNVEYDPARINPPNSKMKNILVL